MSPPPANPMLRSAVWFGSADKNGFMYRSWMKNQDIPDHGFQGKPIIGVCNTWSELTSCNAQFRKLAEHVRRGVPGHSRRPDRHRAAPRSAHAAMGPNLNARSA
jgi:L-arabonate dehydrase